ncbi:MAG: HDIG domain-containing metalloprotein [Chlamydiota bacterium]
MRKDLALAGDSPERSYKRLLGASKLSWRCVLVVAFAMTLCLFLQLREVKIDILELNAISKQYVVAQTAFDFPDQEKTIFLQQQSMQDIGDIYRFDSKEVYKTTHEFEERLLQNQDWRKKLSKITFEQLYGYAEAVEKCCVESRFSDERTIVRMQGVEVASEFAFILPDSRSENPNVPSSYWITIKDRVFSQESDSAVTGFVMDFFKHGKWRLQEDVSLEKRMKQMAKDSVPEQFTLIEAGSFILEPGEKVTLRHIMLVQSMKKAMGGVGYSFSLLSIMGTLALSLIITFLTISYLKLYHKDIFCSLRRLTLLTVIAMMTLAIAKGTEYLLLYKGYNLIEAVRFPLVVPFASILLCILLGARIALFSSIFLSVIISLGLVIEYDRFLVLNLIASMCTIIFARGLHRRKEICEVCGKVWICCLPVLMAFHLEEGNFWQMSLAVDVATAFVFMSITAILVVGLLPLFEIIFNIVTDMTLMEYMDPNSELLRRLSLEAPGTYQHSLVVGNIAEIAARSIGANDLFCRVAALYHDIGKLFNPHYFTENQLGGFNIHQLLTPLESTHVIIAHVAEGEILAKKHSLPQSFVDVIREHHGNSLVYFFYCKQIEQMDGDPSKVNEKLFRYPGPRPHTKEAALIMIADTVEAASRSLDEVTEDAFVEMVDRLIAEKAEEGQFDECPITFQELGTVKKAIVKALLVTRHLRIKYPTRALT